MRDQVLELVLEVDPDVVIVEGPSYNSVSRSTHERGGLWWMITEVVDAGGIAVAVAPPTNIKKYATGFGGGPNADKDYVLAAAVRRFEWFRGNNDEADALWACAMAHDAAGEPLVQMPAKNREALAGCDWPENVAFSRSDDSKSM